MFKLTTLVHKTNRLTPARGIHRLFEDFKFGDNPLVKPPDRDTNVKNVRSAASIENKSREFLRNLVKSNSDRVSLIHLELLVAYLKKHVLARGRVNKDGGVKHLLALLHTCRDSELRKQAKLALALLGYVEPVRGKGIRILSLDGGGTRGVMTIRILREISEICQQPIHELFDLIIGTSTGAILAVLLGVQNQTLTKCELMYDKLGSEIFQTRLMKGTTQLLFNHAYYDTFKLEGALKDEVGDKDAMIDSAVCAGPKVALVSTLVNHQHLKSYVFRNYCLPHDDKSFYIGSSKHKLWQAIRASSAAPGFFEELLLDGNIHQDGGLLTNNPTAIAIQEAKALWPSTPIQAVVSIGTGTYHGRTGAKSPNFSTLREKLMKLIYSATDVEATHEILKSLLPPQKYIRLNPNMSADIPLDTTDRQVILQLHKDTVNYIDKFSYKFDTVAKALLREKSLYDQTDDHLRLYCYRKGWI